MGEAGAQRLRKAIQQLEKRKGSSHVVIARQAPSLIKIEKRTSSSESRIEFSLQVRVENSGSKETWWPVEYRSATGESISCETVLNGKVLVNLAKQDQLIELAEAWAKSLEAQHTVSTVGNALL